MAGVFSTPRPVPSRRVPALAGGAVIVLGLPVFIVGDFPIGGWALAAVLWAARELGADRVRVLDYATSGDVTGDMDRVVGYAAGVVTGAAT